MAAILVVIVSCIAAQPDDDGRRGGHTVGEIGAGLVNERFLPTAPDIERRLTAQPFVEPLRIDGDDAIGMNARDLSPRISVALPIFGDDIRSVSRFSLLGPEGAPGVETGVAIAAPVGALSLDASAFVGRSLGEREDIDVNGSAAISAPLRHVDLGLEARVRGEIVDEHKTAEDDGRPVDLLVGPSATFEDDGVQLKMIGGFSSPRGNAPQGGALQVFFTFEL